MYRCSECGCEYSIKPDFCDCGNDIFIDITPKVEPIASFQNDSVKRDYYAQKPSYKSPFDPVSIIIFVICIILSILSFIFIKPNENVEENVVEEQPKTERKVADIESFWDNTPPNVEIIKPKEDKTITNQIKDVITQTVSSVQQVKPINDTTKNKVVTPKKTTTTPVKKNKTVKKTTTQNNNVKNSQTKPKTSTSQPKTTSTVPKSSNNQPQPQPTTPPQQSSQNTVGQVIMSIPTITLNVQELNNYKNSLRDTIGRRIDFTKVYGDGMCVVEFRVDSNGNLINRKFTTQSSNNTLNDEVFKAVQGVPVYKMPPDSYNGQVMKLTVKYSKGRYSVSLN